MARVNIPLTAFTPNSSTADPSGTAADAANGHNITGAPPEEIVLRVVLATSGGARTVTVGAGDNPPALSAGQGGLAVACPDNDTTFIGPFESARFSQSDGSLDVDVDVATNVTISAFHLPRTA